MRCTGRELRRALTALLALPAFMRRVEKHMAKATEQLNTLTGKVDDLIGDVRAALNTIDQDELSPQAQAALDSLAAKVDAFDAEVGDADGSDGTDAEPTEPAPEPNPLPVEGDELR